MAFKSFAKFLWVNMFAFFFVFESCSLGLTAYDREKTEPQTKL